MSIFQKFFLGFVLVGGVTFSIQDNLVDGKEEYKLEKVVKNTVQSKQIQQKDKTKEVKKEWNTDSLVFFDKYKFAAETASTPSRKTRGLSGRKTFPKNHAMLFVFSDNTYNGFWMKDMYLSIDMVWLDENRNVVHIEREVDPNTFPKVFGDHKKSKYVLEFESGTSEKIGIKIGSHFKF